MVRFFVEPSEITGGAIYLNDEDFRHIRVLRLRPDERFTVCDGSGTDYICRLGECGGTAVEIIEEKPSDGEPTAKCTVFMAFMKGDRLDIAVQKSVELGADGIVLFPSERCIAVPDGKSKKTERLQRIALEAAKQSGRGKSPAVTTAGSFEDAVLEAANADTPLFFYECEDKLHIKQALSSRAGETYSIFTGPEGGFTPEEAGFAVSRGMSSVSLGRRVLRCETAPLCALTAVMYHTGNL